MNKMKLNRIRKAALLLWVGFLFHMISFNAAAAGVSFGSSRYTKNVDETFPVGMYLNAEGDIGEYHITLHYDPRYLQYVSGADRADTRAGNLYFEGTHRANDSRYWLQFQALREGSTYLTVTYAEFYTPEVEMTREITVSGDETEIQTWTEREQYEMSALPNIPVRITAPAVEPEEPQADPNPPAQEEPPVDGNSTAQEDPALTDPTNPEQQQENQPEANQEPQGQETESGTQGENAGDVPKNQDPEGSDSQNSGQIQENEQETDGSADHQGQEMIPAANPEIPTEGLSSAEPEPEKKSSFFFNPVFLLIFLIAIIAIIVEIIIYSLMKKKEKKAKEETEKNPPAEEQDEIIDLERFDFYDSDGKIELRDYYDVRNDADYMLWEESMIEKYGKPVISVEDVTMEFHLSSYNPSGLKDYLIQLMKRQIVYRKLYALYHVSFNVFKGEVLGIIGTNGSGKSTLLKIVSGALKPTEGKVVVNRKKVQLLTLGTGFDMELTARENVYLNGSIIGYSKEFLDKHYKDIVEFAELENFMEEKVKNFSSGMVSRLGFAIATAGEAAEILILDEVLSVGDEFFRKKSLARVKELIHGGSTVLLVSHGMATILENCTRCVWIEKGKLKMVGEPKVVCEAYRKFGGELK